MRNKTATYRIQITKVGHELPNKILYENNFKKAKLLAIDLDKKAMIDEYVEIIKQSDFIDGRPIRWKLNKTVFEIVSVYDQSAGTLPMFI